MKHNVVTVITALYVFFIVGLIFHTSRHPVILSKYSPKYFFGLVLLIALYFPLYKAIVYLFQTSQVKVNRKTIRVAPFHKLLIILLLFLLLLISLELFLRYTYRNFESGSYRYTVDYFHPFLQSQLSVQENIHVNSHGFRGEEISMKKPSNTYRIVLLGGSSVLNREVAYEKNAARVLETMLRAKYPNKKIEVINAGKDGYTSEHSLIQYLFKIKDFRPDMIIMWHGVNDLYVSCTPSDTQYGSFKRDYSHSFGAVANMTFEHFKPAPVITIKIVMVDFLITALRDNLYSDIVHRIKNWYLDGFAQRYRSGSPEFIDYYDFPSGDVYKRNLMSFIKVAKEDNVKLLLGNQASLYKPNLNLEETKTVIFPKLVCRKHNKYYSLRSIRKGFEQFNAITERVAKENNIPFINLDATIPKNLSYFVDSVHYTEKGNKLIADTLFSYLTKNYSKDFER